ncbi:hypothetical protein EEW87_16320 [Janibacter melonis]|uniref:Uncharacterized protein n=1 Tax=Janibacter melonis TaxID=262209 RepID=A0A650GDF5_9MICO|nr:hypothetical protein [Janibacter melonis]QGX08236.1 hypothetical protein EEW87_16320 [Janibacter melonis]
MDFDAIHRTALESPEVMALIRAGHESAAWQLLEARTGADLTLIISVVKLISVMPDSAPPQSSAPQAGQYASPFANPWPAAPPPHPPAPAAGQYPQQQHHGYAAPAPAEQPPDRVRLDKNPPPPGSAWLGKWKGRKFKTKKQVLNAVCQHCGCSYQIDGRALNRLLNERGALSTFLRGADAVSMIGSSGNRYSNRAGKQARLNRAEADFDESFGSASEAWAAVLCPSCESDQVLVEAP